ncbi:MAG TPA: VIT domain-containing protein, partial [Anaerolineales bacterium]|nr:VIT domain-containing protein [Anaerolineales bacterium]
MKTKIVALVFVLLLLALPAPARADGIIIPDPPACDPIPCPPRPLPMKQLVIRNHRVSVTIQDQVAVTHVDQVFYNPNDWTIEGIYVFPLPVGAAVNAFTLWIDGKPVQGHVLDADQARQTYEDIVRTMRDPALLEYVGQGAVQASIFPIPAQGERRVELEYTQVLSAENGLLRYVYPLNTEKFSALPLEEVSINLDVRAASPIRAVYSPSHQIAVSREGDYHVRAGYEAKNVLPDADFALYYSIGASQAFHLLTYRDPNEPDGFFLLMLAPRVEQETASIPKDVILVLDRSGSMEGEKFRQAQEALSYILSHLNSQDRFNIITFSTGVDSYAGDLRPAVEANEAISWVNRFSAEGSTDINRALLEAAAVADNQRPVYLIFLTDGLPTEGVVDSQQILDNLAAAASGNLRLFAFGVGYDVDTFLLDSLAQAHHGSSTYVMPDERLDEILSAFYAKISTPMLTNLSLDFGDLEIYDLFPDPLPDLFAGSQIIGVGRYRQGGTTDVILRGEVNGTIQTFRYAQQIFTTEGRADASLSVLPRLWATRKIGHLLNKVRLQGPDEETVDQIVHLSIRYGIVTPYTSYLVTETPLGAEAQERI